MTSVETYSTFELLGNPEPVLTVRCKEKQEIIERSVYPMPLTMPALKVFWEKSRQYPTLFTQETRGDFGAFMRMLLHEDMSPKGLFWVVDDFVGVYYLTDMKTQDDVLVDAFVHYTFFDGRTRGRVELTRAMIRYVFEKYGFQRFTAEIPLFVKPDAFVFAENVGFVKEGRKRKAVQFDNQWFDVNLFGILQSEVLENGTENGNSTDRG